MANKVTKWILEVEADLAALFALQKEAKLATNIGEDLGDSFISASDDIDKALNDLKKDFKDTSKSAKTATNKIENAVEGVKPEVDDLGKEFEELEQDIKETGKAAADSKNDFNGMLDELEGADYSAIEAGFGGISSGITSVSKAGLAFIATPIGATIAALASIGLVANEFRKYNEQAMEMNEITEQITHTTDNLLTNNRLRAQNIEKTFGKDFEDTLLVAKNLVKAYDITWDEAFNTMEDGFIRGGKVSDEFMDSMREYPKLFANNGFAVQDFQRIVNTGIDLGMYSDKLPDAIKEFSLSVNEQTTASRDALEGAFGKKFTDQLFKEIKDGSKTPKDALMAIAEETKRVGVNAVDAQVLTADLFRGAGEDAGGFVEIIDAMNTALLEQPAILNGLQEHLKKTADANLELAKAQSTALESADYKQIAQDFELAWIDIKIFWYDLVYTVSYEWNQLQNNLQTGLFVVTELFNLFPATISTAFKTIKKEGMDVINSFGKIGEILQNLIDFEPGKAYQGAKDFINDFTKETKELVVTALVTPLNLTDEFGRIAKEAEDFVQGAQLSKKMRLNGLLEGGGDSKPDTLDVDDNVVDDLVKDPLSKTRATGSGNGTGSGKAITMTLNIVQNFYETAKQDVEEIASETVRLINDRLKDAVIQTAS